jgi:hypothetical protein
MKHRAASLSLVLFLFFRTMAHTHTQFMKAFLLVPLLFCTLTITVIETHANEPQLPAKIEFNRDVRPILSDNCFSCHGNDAGHRKAKLRLDVREAALKKDAFVPGKPDESDLIERIFSADEDELMPPPESHKKLTAQQKEILKRWIEQGAEYQLHWSYKKPVKAEIPSGQNGIDVLVQKRLTEIGFKPSPEADRHTLIRRLYSDLLGLPPKPEEVAAFVNDASPKAYEALIERVLASPHYGERMAIGWLDVVRFADTIGYHSDNPQNIWPYRDWIIQSFNENKRFDRFTLEQVAGDLLPDASQQTRVASAFNRLILSTAETGAQELDYASRMLTDRVRAIGAGWMGQTTGCAQCHDHKFDPITMRDFYSLGAFFADLDEPIIGYREDGMLVINADQEKQLAKLDATVAETKKKNDANALAKAESERKRFYDPLPKCLVSISAPQKRTVRILPRGNWMDESGEIVKAALPHYLPQPKIEGRELTRLDLAQWLVSRENPLTGRTVMNRLWKQFFGTGLSRVLDDLGAQGEPPVNPALLDWLACEFMDSGWDMKHMIRTVVTSHTYMQVSTASKELVAADPYNRELARQSRFRVDAELVRDNALAISGLLVPKIGGPSVKPYQPEHYWQNLNDPSKGVTAFGFPEREYITDMGESQYRRGLYTWWQRTALHPAMLAFDAPSREECAAERNRSNIPQQALVLLNDPTFVEAARVFAARILTECPGDTAARLQWAWQQVLQRAPLEAELKTITPLLDERLAAYRADGASAEALLKVGLAPVPATLDKAELAAWTHVARVLLNLHETITRS